VLETVRNKLLTPVGLRTLPEDDPSFHPYYTGPQPQRDEAYHQGTIWGWLIGPYAEGVLRVNGFSGKARARARAALTPLLDRLTGEGLGQLAEVFEAQPDADGRYRPVGCIAQAWSVAEVLRVLTLIERGEERGNG
jgi:glycogen debranching enzyme